MTPPPAGGYGHAVIERLGLVVHSGRAAAVAATENVQRWAADRDIPTVEIDVWGADGEARRHAREEAMSAGSPDLIVAIGGDGTFLRGVRVAAAVQAAVLGVNVGRIGFLTQVGADGVVAALDAVHSGHAAIEERLLLTMRASRPLEVPEGLEVLLRYGRGPALPPPTVRSGLADDVGWGVALDVRAVNDVVFEKLARDRQASLGLYINSRLFASYSADALIVSSPTGSTAYSFAAGGPVLSPRVEALVFTPVAPHMAFDRSLILGVDETVSVRVLERSGRVAVTVDGQLRGVLEPGDWVAVYAAPERARLVRLGPMDFFGRLRDRFGLTDAPAAVADGSAPLEYRPQLPVPADLRRLHLTDDLPGLPPERSRDES